MPREAVISTSSLNDKGTRVLTSGIDYAQYAKNPILLYMHSRPYYGGINEAGVIGRMENLRFEGDRMIGTPVFDEQDEFAKKISAKWEGGFLNMLSAGLEIVDVSGDPAMMLVGQSGKTIIKSKLIEISIVDVGSNDDTLALYRDGKMLNLAAGGEDLDFLKLDINQHTDINEKERKMEKIALALGLVATASESEVFAKIASLQKDNGEALELRKQIETERNTAIEQAVNEAITCSRITADKREHFVTLGKTMGLSALTQTLAIIPVPEKPTDKINPQGGTPGGKVETYSKFSDIPTDKLESFQKEDSKEFARLYKTEFGREFKMN